MGLTRKTGTNSLAVPRKENEDALDFVAIPSVALEQNPMLPQWTGRIPLPICLPFEPGLSRIFVKVYL
jgi:hypothetical protein